MNSKGMNMEANEQAVRRFFAHLAAGHTEACLAQMADDATVSVLGKPEKFPLAGIKTKAQMGALLTWAFAMVVPKGVQITLEELTAEGERVAVAAEVCAETASGSVYTQYHHFSLEVCEGKVRALRECAMVRVCGCERLGARESGERGPVPCAGQPLPKSEEPLHRHCSPCGGQCGPGSKGADGNGDRRAKRRRES